MRLGCYRMIPAIIHTYVNRVCLCAADKTGQYVRQLLEPAFITVPAAVDMPALFQSALDISGTLPFPVPDVFYESQRLQNEDMKFYLAPVSKSGATTFGSAIHTVLCKQFPAGTDLVQAGLVLDLHDRLLACALHGLLCVQGRYAACVLCCWLCQCLHMPTLNKEWQDAGQFDQLVCEIMELLDQCTGKLGMKRKRNQGEASLTMMAKRPDLCDFVRNALLFKGEDKYEEGKLDQAVAELKKKMRRWSRSYHGQVNLSLCICHWMQTLCHAKLVSPCKTPVW